MHASVGIFLMVGFLVMNVYGEVYEDLRENFLPETPGFSLQTNDIFPPSFSNGNNGLVEAADAVFQARRAATYAGQVNYNSRSYY